jgi:hypothetical protein
LTDELEKQQPSNETCYDLSQFAIDVKEPPSAHEAVAHDESENTQDSSSDELESRQLSNETCYDLSQFAIEVQEPPKKQEFQPVDTAAILAQYGVGADDATNDELTADSSRASWQSGSYYQEESQPADEGHDPRRDSVMDHHSAVEESDDHQESIEAYMARLLGRTSEPASKSKSVAPPAPAAPAKVASIAATTNDSSDVTEEPKPKPSMPPKRANPLAGTNLSAMRELANSSTRMAIQQHAVRQKGSQVVTSIGLIAILLLVGLIAIILGQSIHFSLTVSGLVVAAGGCFLAYKQCKARKASKRATPKRDANAGQPAE